MRIATALGALGALAAVAAFTPAVPASADTRPRHAVKHRTHVARHPGVHHRPAGMPVYVGPSEYPGYRYGGPLYSTCDRINADRMLVGTCR